jgi:hypothetical protein
MPKKQKSPSIEALVALVKAAAAESAAHQEQFAAEDIEARKIVDIMERFLRIKARVVYGGAAINAHLSAENKFYDPNVNLPDYDFMTPDPLQDCADLVVAFQEEGFTEVDAKFGIHEGTYKVFVNFRPAADITYMPPNIYERLIRDSAQIDGIHYGSVDYLRMNMYLELSRPAGNVSRWEKVYERLLLLNLEYPLKAGRCVAEPLEGLGLLRSKTKKGDESVHDRIVATGIEQNAIFLSGAHYLVDTKPKDDEVILMMTDKADDLVTALKQDLDVVAVKHESIGELLSARTELFMDDVLISVIFETVACHSYTTLNRPEGYRLGSLDLLIQMYYAFYFADLDNYLPIRLLCVIQELMELEKMKREEAAASDGKIQAHDVFPLDCIGHQPSMPELKKAHRDRVREKKQDLVGALRIQNSERFTRKIKRLTHRHRNTRGRKA